MKLGNFLYADACPHCQEALEHNNTSKFTVSAPKHSLPINNMFPLPMLRWFGRLVES
jgi:hypothetical protein